jgi:glyoxylase-like metal-dependent hydrolase (beta-lactamase superfamily II)
VIFERSTDRRLLSNAYLVADRDGGTAIAIDTGAPLDRLLRTLERRDLRLVAVLCTHRHEDHVAGNDELVHRTDALVLASRLEAPHISGASPLDESETRRFGELTVRVVPLPGHTSGQCGFLVADVGLFTGDCLFRGSIGGTIGSGATSFEDVRRSIERIFALPDETPIHPGHGESTTVAAERATNPFVRAILGLETPAGGRCVALGRPADLVVLATDYDGGTKAWVRFDDGRDALVPGSRVVVSIPPS